LICSERHIFVADTGNHAIRRIDAETGETVTLAGTGARGCALPSDGAPGCDTSLASVWDLERVGKRLFFANAGTHQIGELDLASLEVRALAGSSAEDILDGPAGEANLAQPSGLACDEAGHTLYFTDSETSAIRALSLDGSPRVETLVGTGLFDFGCDNGPFGEALFQHPLGIACCDGGLVVADSYNGKLRRLDLRDRCVSDMDESRFCCGGGPVFRAGEPAGVTADGTERLLMADTNNHRIVEIRPGQRRLKIWTS
jgi:sugar lactone lactonase YvrE